MNHGSLFSGIGGFDLAAEWVGWSNEFHCDFDPFCQTILKHNFPYATSYSNIKDIDFSPWRGKVDILSGGFPCQPFSQAGKRLGTADGRHLWPEMLRAVREVRPRWVVGENVLGIVNWNAGLVFEQVCADLEAEGYEVQPFILPAAGVNAPHQRYRTWFVAHANGRDEEGGAGKIEGAHGSERVEERDKVQFFGKPGVLRRFIPHTTWNAYSCGKTALGRTTGGQDAKPGRARGAGRGRFDPNTNIDRPQKIRNVGGGQGSVHSQKASARFKHGYLSKNWSDFPSQSPFCRGDDGLPRRLDGITFPRWRRESIKAYGNAIVPQVAYRIFKAINEYESR